MNTEYQHSSKRSTLTRNPGHENAYVLLTVELPAFSLALRVNGLRLTKFHTHASAVLHLPEGLRATRRLTQIWLRFYGLYFCSNKFGKTALKSELRQAQPLCVMRFDTYLLTVKQEKYPVSGTFITFDKT